MRWFPWRRGDRSEPASEAEPASEPARLGPAAIHIVDQLVDHYHDGWPTATAWYLDDAEPRWEALEELRRLGYCEVTRDHQMVEVDFTELGRRLYV